MSTTSAPVKKGLLANAFQDPKWDSRIKSANTTGKEMWLGYVVGPYGMLLGQSIVNSYFNKYLTDILGFTVSRAAWIATFMVLFPIISKLLDAVTNIVMNTRTRTGKQYRCQRLKALRRNCLPAFCTPKFEEYDNRCQSAFSRR